MSPGRFPLVLYAVNGLLPIAICLRQGMWWAGVGGAVAMAIPLARAVRAGAPRAVAASDRAPRPIGVPVAGD